MTDTMVPSSSRKEKASRLMVELYVDGQHDDRRQEAEPHKQDAQLAREPRAKHAPMLVWGYSLD